MDMKREYYEDIELIGSGVVLFWSAAFLIFLFTLPISSLDTPARYHWVMPDSLR